MPVTASVFFASVWMIANLQPCFIAIASEALLTVQFTSESVMAAAFVLFIVHTQLKSNYDGDDREHTLLGAM